MTEPCPECEHPRGSHNASYGCQRKGCSCKNYTTKRKREREE